MIFIKHSVHFLWNMISAEVRRYTKCLKLDTFTKLEATFDLVKTKMEIIPCLHPYGHWSHLGVGRSPSEPIPDLYTSASWAHMEYHQFYNEHCCLLLSIQFVWQIENSHIHKLQGEILIIDTSIFSISFPWQIIFDRKTLSSLKQQRQCSLTSIRASLSSTPGVGNKEMQVTLHGSGWTRLY